MVMKQIKNPHPFTLLQANECGFYYDKNTFVPASLCIYLFISCFIASSINKICAFDDAMESLRFRSCRAKII